MQGLLFENISKVVKILKIKNRKKIQDLKKILIKYNLSLATLSLLIIIKNPLIKRIILGFNDEKQLLDIFKELNKAKGLKIQYLKYFYFEYNKNFNILNWKKN